MAKPNRILEWEVVASDNEWEQQRARQTIAAPIVRRRWAPSSRLVNIVMVAMLITGVAAYLLWREARAGLEKIDNDVALAVEAESWRAQMRPAATANSRPLSTLEQLEYRAVSPGFYYYGSQSASRARGDKSTRTMVTNVTYDDAVPGLAIIEVAKADDKGNIYRETQFYRELEGRGWQRMTPDVAFWGASVSRQTPHFQWSYRARDGEAVSVVAGAMEQAYAQFRRDVGLSAVAPTTPIRIEVRTVLIKSPSAGFANNLLLLSSPLLVVAPTDLNQVEVLRTSALELLAQYTLQLAEQEQPRWCSWRPLFPGLVQWQVQSQGGRSLVSQELPAAGLPSLTSLLESEENCLDRPVTLLKPGASDPTSTTLAANLFAYVAERYGSDGIPTLLAAFRHNATWDTALDTAFNVSDADFEAGWHKCAARQLAP